MHKHITTALLVGAFSALPIIGFAAAAAKAEAPAVAKQASTKAKPSATHATRGVVKSIDSGTLVITRSGKKRGDMTFTLDSSTRREGTVAVGTPVSVRYREDGKAYVATAINVQQPKQPAGHAAPSKR
jgi:Cu/Ag efflux protein CusF